MKRKFTRKHCAYMDKSDRSDGFATEGSSAGDDLSSVEYGASRRWGMRFGHSGALLVAALIVALCMVVAPVSALARMGGEASTVEKSDGTSVQTIDSRSVDDSSEELAASNAGTSDGMTRVEWLSRITEAFDMSVDSDEYPDNYFSDLSSDSEYYRSIMIATEFGLIDVEAGDPVYPDQMVTREFAAHTLNFCLGFQLDENPTYTFSDVGDVLYPDDDQIALNRSWFNLIEDKFEPSNQAARSELESMLDDGIRCWQESRDTSAPTNNTYTFVEGVVVVPEDCSAAMDEGGNIQITNCPSALKEGCVFVVYSEGVPFGYKAKSLTQVGGMTVVSPEEVPGESVFVDANAGGVVDVDLEDFEEAEGVTVSISPQIEELPSSGGIQARSINYKNKVLTVSKNFGSGSNSVEVKASYSNLKFSWKSAGYYSVRLTGDVKYTLTGKGSRDFTADFGSVPLGMIGRFYVSSNISFSGSVSATQSGSFETGLEYRGGDGFRYLKSFSKKGWPCVTAQCNVDAGITVGLEFGVPLIKGSVGASVGVIVGATVNKYSSGSPKVCAVISGSLYSRVRASATFGIGSFSRSKSKSWDIWTPRNSPIRFVNHYHDGVAVGSHCSKGNSVRYTTPAWSRYTGNGYYGYEGAGSSSYTDSTGEPFTIFEYTLDDKNQATITKYYGNVSALMIPDTIDGYKVVAIGNSAFSNTSLLTSVVIPDSIITIYPNSFSRCANLNSVSLSGNLKTLNYLAFSQCTSLTSVEIPKSLETGSTNTINSYYGPFSECSSLKSIAFEQGTTKVAYKLFSNCTGLETVDIPDTVVAIEAFAFQRCVNLKSVSIPNSVTTIGGSDYYGGAFSDCESLEEIVIPDSVISIGQRAFAGCTALSKLTLSKNLKTLNYLAFSQCTSLTSVEIPKSLENANSYSNSYSGPFDGCSSLKVVIFEAGVKKIPSRLFEGCNGFESIEIPETVTLIERRAFYNCALLNNVMIPDSVQSIGEFSFSNCASISSVELSKSLRDIPNSLFSNCSALTTIVWPESLETIGTSAFDGCSSLKAPEFPKTLTTINQYAFRDNDALDGIVIPDSVTTLGSYAFYDCDGLTSISLGSGLTSIKDNTFKHCDKLQSIVLPYFMESVGNNAFAECSNLSSITIPRLTTNIASNAFSYPTKMTAYGVSGTYAETYANEKGMRFVSQEVHAESVSLSETDVKINKGSTITLIPSIMPTSFTDEIVWKSSNQSVASVDNRGVVKGISSGTTTVKLMVGDLSASCSVSVIQPVTSIYISPRSRSLEALDELKLSASIYPSDAFNKTITWSSSNPEIASVNENGLVKAISKGSTTIKAVANDGSAAEDSITITVLNNAHIMSSLDGFESPHGYTNNCSDYWAYTLPGASKISVVFDERTSVEDGFDFICIYDKTGTSVGEYTGNSLAGKTISLTGDTVKIKLVSDSGGSDWGFKVIDVKEAKTSSISKSLTTIQSGKSSTVSGGSAAKVKGGTVTMVATQSGIPATKYPIAGNITAFKVQNATGFTTKAFNVTYTDTSGKQIKLTNGNGLTRVGEYSPSANTYEFLVPDAKDISVNVTFEFTAKTTEITKALTHLGGTTSASSCEAGTVEMVATQSGITATKYPKVGGRTAFKVTIKKGYKVSAFNVTYTDASGKQIKLTNGNGLTRVGTYSATSNTYEFDVPASNDVKVNVTYVRQ